MDLKEYGFDNSVYPEINDGIPARVLSVHKDNFSLVCPFGHIRGHLKASNYYGVNNSQVPVTGDFVLIHYNETGSSQIFKTLNRKSVFTRELTSRLKEGYTKNHVEQIIASNFDYVFIMTSLNHDFNLGRIERYLIVSWQSGAIPVVILSKADLVENYEQQLHDVQNISSGAMVIALSSKTGYGFDELAPFIKPNKTIVLLGSSGVGKSSLLNRLAGKQFMEVNEIREDDSKGRHTTTHRQLFKLGSGAMIIDTPGIRELGVGDAMMGLSQGYADVEKYFRYCKYKDCKHRHEPGCAIKKALDNGELTEERWISYMKYKREIRHSNTRKTASKKKQNKYQSMKKLSKRELKYKCFEE